MPSKAKTIDDYLAGLPREQRAALEGIRKAVRAAVPRGEECISCDAEWAQVRRPR